MARTTRPRTHTERDTCIAALAALSIRDLPPLAVAAAAQLAPARDQYLAARATHRSASGLRDEAAAEAERVDAAFDRTLRRWSVTVVDGDGRPVRGELAAMFGGLTASVLVRRPYREEVTRTADLLLQLEARPSLSGDPARLAELIEAHRALSAATDTLEAAGRAEREAGARLSERTPAFDAAWGQLVKALQLVLGDVKLAGVVPSFVRAGRSGGAAPTPGLACDPMAPPAPDLERADPEPAAPAVEPAAPEPAPA